MLEHNLTPKNSKEDYLDVMLSQASFETMSRSDSKGTIAHLGVPKTESNQSFYNSECSQNSTPCPRNQTKARALSNSGRQILNDSEIISDMNKAQLDNGNITYEKYVKDEHLRTRKQARIILVRSESAQRIVDRSLERKPLTLQKFNDALQNLEDSCILKQEQMKKEDIENEKQRLLNVANDEKEQKRKRKLYGLDRKVQPKYVFQSPVKEWQPVSLGDNTRTVSIKVDQVSRGNQNKSPNKFNYPPDILKSELRRQKQTIAKVKQELSSRFKTLEHMQTSEEEESDEASIGDMF